MLTYLLEREFVTRTTTIFILGLRTELSSGYSVFSVSLNSQIGQYFKIKFYRTLNPYQPFLELHDCGICVEEQMNGINLDKSINFFLSLFKQHVK
jgi:hypothetical protein